MPRKSDISKYPAELRAAINDLLDDPKNTLDDVVKKANALILDEYLDENEMTRSSLGRYAKKRREDFERAMQLMAQQKARRKEFFDRFGDAGLDNAGRYAAEMLYSSIMQLQSSTTVLQSSEREEDDPVTLGELDVHSKIVQRVSASIGNLEKSLTENKSRVDAIKKEAREEALQEATESIEEALGEDGASAKTINKIKTRMLNLKVKT